MFERLKRIWAKEVAELNDREGPGPLVKISFRITGVVILVNGGVLLLSWFCQNHL